jgi:GT2 family glycosyltransferase
VAFLDTNPQVIATGCFMRYVSAQGRVLGVTGQIVTAVELAAIGRGELFPFRTSSLLVRRSALAQIGGFDEMLGRHGAEDLDLYARLARLGLMTCIPNTLGSYRMHPNSFMARRRREVNEAARFVRLRLQARDQGMDLTWETFRRDHPLSWGELRQDLVGRAYRAAALSYAESRYTLAFAYGSLAVLIDPYYSLRRVHQQRWARPARQVRNAQPITRGGRSSR